MLEGQPIVAEFAGSSFRGEFLQCCAEIEDRLCLALERLVELGEIKRPPYLFGQKFERVKKSVALSGLWKHKDHVGTVFEELQPFVELRGTLGHALMGTAVLEGKSGVSWRVPGDHDWKSRRAMTHAEMQQTLTELRRLTNKFLKQPLADKP